MCSWEASRETLEKGKERRATQPLGSVHLDLIGPFSNPSYGGSRYVLTFIDDYFRLGWVCFLKLKSHVFEHLNIWKALIEIRVDIILRSLGLIMGRIM